MEQVDLQPTKIGNPEDRQRVSLQHGSCEGLQGAVVFLVVRIEAIMDVLTQEVLALRYPRWRIAKVCVSLHCFIPEMFSQLVGSGYGLS